jgi:hypothetical protein
MDEEIINGVQGLPGTAESEMEKGREKAQKAQEERFHFAAFAIFSGYFPNGSGFRRSRQVTMIWRDVSTLTGPWF